MPFPAAIISLISLGHWVEARVSTKASRSLESLLNLAPKTARRVRASISPRVPRNVSFTRTTYLAIQTASRTTARPLAGDFVVVTEKNRSPRINHVSWGRLEIEGRAEPYKDAKLFPGGSREWNWRETGTNHVPGIQQADVQELLDHGAKIIVLSRGMKECLEVPTETLEFLKKRQIEAHVLPTAEAAQLYNRLAETEWVGGLFHTTC